MFKQNGIISIPRKTPFSKFKYLAIALSIILLSILTLNIFTNPVSAADASEDIIETTFFGNLKDDGKGCGVYTVINSVVDIMSIGIGILAVIGIMIVGIQYLTAKDNEQQVVKAKKRMLEIVIGLVAYAVLYTLLQWLLPGAKLNNNITCSTVSDEYAAQVKEAKEAAKISSNTKKTDTNTTKTSDQTGSGNPSSNVKNTAPFLVESQFNSECLRKDELTTGEKIVCILDKISIWADKNKIHYGNQAWRSGKNTELNCASYTTAAYIEAGILKSAKQRKSTGGDYFALSGTTVQNWDSVKKRGTLVKASVPSNSTIRTLAKQGKLLPGDTIGAASHHTYMYIGQNNAGVHMCQQLGRNQTMTSTGPFHHNKSKFQCGSRKVYVIVHPKRDITISL